MPDNPKPTPTLPTYSRDQIRKFVLKRYAEYFNEPKNVSDEFDLDYAINKGRPGRPHKVWHMTEFAKVDDLIEAGIGPKEACRRVLEKLPESINYTGKDTDHETSFRNIFYKFKNSYEKSVRKDSFTYSVVEHNFEEATEQCFRLSKITDITLAREDW